MGFTMQIRPEVLKKLREDYQGNTLLNDHINSKCTGAFCGYGVAVADFQHPVIDFDRNNTYIQSEGINQDFGVYDSPEELLKEHHQELSPIKKLAFRHFGRHMMNRNVKKIRSQIV